MNEVDLDKLHTNQKLLVQELEKRGIKVWILDQKFELLEAQYKDHHEFILDRFGVKTPHTLTLISRDKYVAKHLLKRNGLSVPEGKLFDKEQIKAALEYGSELGWPVVAKPNWGSHGDNVFMDLNSEFELKKAIDLLLGANPKMPFFVERQFIGKEHRIFITQNGEYAVVHRDPAHVIGDGLKTLKELSELETERRMNPRSTVLSPLILDEVVFEHLRKQKLELDFIPKKGEKIYLRLTSNVAKGATCEEVTEKVHPSLIEIAKRALKVF